jgi:hypothetical protein
MKRSGEGGFLAIKRGKAAYDYGTISKPQTPTPRSLT